MSGAAVSAEPAAARTRLLRRLDALLQGVSRLLMVVCMLALVGAALVLSYSVFARHVLKLATDWQDEAAVFLLVGATFVSAAHVQHLRGHIGIEAITTLLSPRVNRVRRWCVDMVSFAFCGMEVVDAVLGSLCRWPDEQFDVGAAPVDSVWPDGLRHDVAHGAIAVASGDWRRRNGKTCGP